MQKFQYKQKKLINAHLKICKI